MQLTVLKRLAGIILPVVLLGLAISCRSARNNDAGFIKRTYHNVTARYNGYFNARALFRETVGAFELGYMDSYDQLLPIVRIPGESQAQDLAASMGTVISKASEMIDRHEISRWTDDAYLMIGKANFYRYDFQNALLSLQYVYNEYDDNDIRQEALAWIGLSNMLAERHQDAETAFDIALSNIDSSEVAAPFIYAAAAQFNVQRDRLNLAIPLLKKALETVRGKETRTRYAFVTAQLYEKAGQADSAIAYYNRVIELNPAYKIVFNTRLAIARLYNVTGPGGEGIEEELWKMMEDEKNQDYIDQLYYVLGTIAEKKNNQQEAISYYTQSVRSSTVNKNQQGIAYLGIANIWFREGDYGIAMLYYDSTMAVLSPNYPGYEQVRYRSGKLKALADHRRAIRREDSLQHLAGMSPVERMKIVDGKVKELQAAREEQRRQAAQALSSGMSRGQSNSLRGRVGAGSWYFYNTTALSQGYSEFLRRWSNRPNENNWRRSNKQSLAGLEADGGTPDGAESVTGDDPEVLRTQLLANIPLNPGQLDSSNYRIATAYYEIARIYENDLLSPDDAVRYYEELLQRFPENNYMLPTWYSLYKLYQGNDPTRSEAYKKLILEQYPESDYALVISNPGSVLARQEETDSQLNLFYEETYRFFREGQYAEVIARSQSPQAVRSGPSLAAKFALLQAMAVGRTDSIPQFTASLERVSATFPQEEPGRRAEAWLSYVRTHPEEFSGRNPALLEGGSWLTDFDAIQRRMAEKARREAAELARARAEAERNSYFKQPFAGEAFTVVIAVSDPSLNLNSTRFGLGQLNRRLYDGKNYQHALKTINNEAQLVSVGSFENLEAAKEYYETLLRHRGAVVQAPDNKTEIFYLTNSNFDRLVDAKTLREYRYYFRVNFLSGRTAASLPTVETQPAEAPLTGEQVREALPDGEAADEQATEPLVSDTGQAGADPVSVSPPAETDSVETVPTTVVSSRFSAGEEDSKYLLVVAVNDAAMNLNSTRQGIGLFNRGYFSRMNYKHNSKTVNNESQLISVTLFSSREEAENYYREFMKRREQVVRAPDAITDIFLITRDNFLLLDSQQIVDEYVTYFKIIYQRADE